MEPDTWDIYYDAETGMFYAQSGPTGDVVHLDIKHEDEEGYSYELNDKWFRLANVNLSDLPKPTTPRYVVELGGIKGSQPLDVGGPQPVYLTKENLYFIKDRLTGEHTRKATPNAKDGFTSKELADQLAREWNAEWEKEKHEMAKGI